MWVPRNAHTGWSYDMSDFAVEVIACTMVDWNKFISVSKKIFNESPTRELDAKKITVGDPGSFAMAIEVINNRREAVGDLSKAYRSLDFIQFVFMVYLSDGEELEGFANLLELTHLQYANRSSGSMIIGGTVRQIKEAIVFGCELSQYRQLFNRMHSLLCQHGFSTLFGMKKGLPDGSFTLT